jgi:hypothetical protein
MAHVPDMLVDQTGRVSVGWLHPDHPYPQADAHPAFAARLQAFADHWLESVEALGWPIAMGIHTCEFCHAAHASGTFGVPTADGQLFFAPALIAHYVDHHRYAPPPAFVAAVTGCPLPGTAEYARASLKGE